MGKATMGLFKKTKETETRMNREEMLGAIKKIQGWKIAADFSVGGLEWIAFSKRCPSMLVVISSQKSTMVDGKTGKIKDCEVEYDEEALLAYCDGLPDEELKLAGQYGGKLRDRTARGEYVDVETDENFETTIDFVSEKQRIRIFQNYGFYTCGFGYDDNGFVLAYDGGIILLQRFNEM
jgi:hypothetical protein